MKQIYQTTLRLNLADEDDRRAFEYLQRVDKKQYRSCNKAIVACLNIWIVMITAFPKLKKILPIPKQG